MDAPEADTRPMLQTERLMLRPFELSDAETFEILINDREIAANTRTIDYPYPKGEAANWISRHRRLWLTGKSAIFAICDLRSGQLMGAVGLEVSEPNQHAELGYWLGRDYWSHGFCTEAASAVVKFGLIQMGLYKVHAHYLSRNPASGRVLEKIGMFQEGYLRGHVRKWGVFEDVVCYGILASDLEADQE